MKKVFFLLLLISVTAVSNTRAEEFSRKDKFLFYELSVLGQHLPPGERATPQMRAWSWKDSLAQWFSPTRNGEIERMKHKESLERLLVLQDPRSFDALFQIAFVEHTRYFADTITLAQRILVELSHLWAQEQLGFIATELNKRIQEEDDEKDYFSHQNLSRLKILKQKIEEEISHASKRPFDSQDTLDALYHYHMMALGAAHFPRDMLLGIAKELDLSSHPKDILMLPTRLGAGVMVALWNGIVHAPEALSGLLSAGHSGAAGYDAGQKLANTANTILIIYGGARVAQRLRTPRTSDSSPAIVNEVPNSDWGNPNPFGNSEARSAEGSVATLNRPTLAKLLDDPQRLRQDPLPETIEIPETVPAARVSDPVALTKAAPKKLRITIIRKDIDGNVIGVEQKEVDENALLDSLKTNRNDEVYAQGNSSKDLFPTPAPPPSDSNQSDPPSPTSSSLIQPEPEKKEKDPYFHTLLLTLSNSAKPETKKKAREELIQMGSKALRPLLQAYQSEMKHPSPSGLGILIYDVLTHMGPSIIPPLLHEFRTAQTLEDFVLTGQLLLKIQTDRFPLAHPVVEHALLLLKSPQVPSSWKLSAQKLIRQAGPSVIPQLIENLKTYIKDETPTGVNTEIPSLDTKLMIWSEEGFAGSIEEVLFWMGPSSLPHLMALLQNPSQTEADVRLKFVALNALERLRLPESIPPLINALHHEKDGRVLKKATRTLRYISRYPYVETALVLFPLLDNPDLSPLITLELVKRLLLTPLTPESFHQLMKWLEEALARPDIWIPEDLTDTSAKASIGDDLAALIHQLVVAKLISQATPAMILELVQAWEKTQITTFKERNIIHLDGYQRAGTLSGTIYLLIHPLQNAISVELNHLPAHQKTIQALARFELTAAGYPLQATHVHRSMTMQEALLIQGIKLRFGLEPSHQAEFMEWFDPERRQAPKVTPEETVDGIIQAKKPFERYQLANHIVTFARLNKKMRLDFVRLLLEKEASAQDTPVTRGWLRYSLYRLHPMLSMTRPDEMELTTRLYRTLKLSGKEP